MYHVYARARIAQEALLAAVWLDVSRDGKAVLTVASYYCAFFEFSRCQYFAF